MADPTHLLRQFVAALKSNSRAASNEAALSLIGQAAPLGEKWRSIARVMQTNGELTAANRAMELFVEQTGNSNAARFEQAAMAAQTGQVERSWTIMKSIPEDVPDRPGHAFILGTIALNQGEIERAEQHLLAALDADPRLGQAMLALAASRRRTGDDPIAQRILSIAPTMVNAPILERAQYHYAVGRIRFDRGDVDAAFSEFQKGAELASTERPHDPDVDRADAYNSCRNIDSELLERVSSKVSVDTSEAIFVTGLPRSGTTLVEQILVSHSAVTGGEELGRMGIVHRDLGLPVAESLRHLGEAGSPDALAQLYLHLCRERFGIGTRYVDKGLNSTRHIGLIAALLPSSPIVWLRRDPLDCAFSAFRTYFLKGLDWSWKLENIAAHFLLEDEIFAFWSKLLPERILVVDYPSLVAEPKAQINRILAHCNLAAEPQVFEPHKTRRVVSTASAAQVREPINQRGLGSAEPYRKHMKPFTEAYAGR
ncbi:MAG: tetratricopeptide repeat-containing sulfotransferase family protein [Croceibacterium sp.]